MYKRQIDKLKVYLKEAPLVTVRIVNYRISVLGEVTKQMCIRDRD